MHLPNKLSSLLLIFGAVFIASCGETPQTQPPHFPANTAPASETSTVSPAISTVTSIPTQQPIKPPARYGPQAEDFPPGFNPLSGQLVAESGLLDIPALLISISHFPATARPQAGLSFAPWVFEFYITEGATRFLPVFYGQYPRPENPVIGSCEIRQTLFKQQTHILGNRVWLDENENGTQEDYEPGVGGICVNLFNPDGKLIESTSTDSQGYFGFNVGTGGYEVEFVPPAGIKFTENDRGSEESDSDAAPSSGRARIEVSETYLHMDAGLILSEDISPAQRLFSQTPAAEVGPIRSGRLLYDDIGGFFQSSCLIYAFASPEVLEKIPKCSFVPHTFTDGGAMMPLERMTAIAEDHKKNSADEFNYSGNVFTEEPVQGGEPADRLDVYVALLNQSAWEYDAAAGAWQRFVDTAKKEKAGEVHREIDRLNGRNLSFENIIILYADHDVISPTNLDIHLELGGGGYAYLFRDGQKYDIRWSLKAGNYEQQTGRRRPIQFINANGSPAALKPGRTWIFIVTPYSVLSDEGHAIWKLRFAPPQGAK